MAKYYTSLVDIFIYFPCNVFSLKGDDMRPADENYQKFLDKKILIAFKDLEVPKSKIYKLKSISINMRTEEILGLLK